jgi:aldose 1-epimerase
VEKLHIHRLENSTGSFVEIINFGATLLSLSVPDRYGKLGNVLLRYSQMQDYFANPAYLGSTIGRYANRIENSRYQYRGRHYRLQGNEGRHHLHGGASGFSHRFWVFADDCSSTEAHLSLFSEDGDQGYPGNLIVTHRLHGFHTEIHNT